MEEGLTEAESSSGTSMMWDRADASAIQNLRRVSQRLQSFSMQHRQQRPQQQQQQEQAAHGDNGHDAMSSRTGSVSPYTRSPSPTSGEDPLWSARGSMSTLKRVSRTLVSLGGPADFGGSADAGDNLRRPELGLSNETPTLMERLSLLHATGGETSTQTTPRSGAEASAETTPRSGQESESTISGDPTRPRPNPKPKAQSQPGHAGQRRVMVGVGGMNMVV